MTIHNQKKPLVDAATLPVSNGAVLPLVIPTATDIESWWLPVPARDLVEAAHMSLGLPRVMLVAPILCAMATCLQGKATVRISPTWTEELSLWWLVFAESASMKSVCMKMATKPIQQYQNRLEEEIKLDVIRAKARRKALENHLAKLSKDRVEGGKDGSFKNRESANDSEYSIREIVDELANLKVPSVPRLIKTDITPMMLSKRLKHNFESDGRARMSILADEAAFLENLMGRFNKGGGAMLETLLAGWSGDSVYEDRQGESAKEIVEANLDRVNITMCCLVQPDVLDDLKADKKFSRRGFLGRCLVTHTPGGSIPPLDAPEIPKRILEAYSAFLTQLLEWEPEGGNVEVSLMGEMDVVEAAHDQVRTMCQDETENVTAWVKRSVGRVCRIAGLCQLADLVTRGPGTIERFLNQKDETVLNCQLSGPSGGGGGRPRIRPLLQYWFNQLFSLDIQYMQSVERPTGSLEVLARHTLSTLRGSGQLRLGQLTSVRDVQRICRRLADREQTLSVCKLLTESGHMVESDPPRGRRGKATEWFEIVSLDWLGDERPKPTTVQAEPLDPYLDSLPEPDAEPEPEPDLTVDETVDPAEDWWRE